MKNLCRKQCSTKSGIENGRIEILYARISISKNEIGIGNSRNEILYARINILTNNFGIEKEKKTKSYADTSIFSKGYFIYTQKGAVALRNFIVKFHSSDSTVLFF
ncbi:MAG: hypothetical protein PUF12_09480 [Thermoflexaceae bacterium]|nr:hypothetical protein [Thermoflexaceae bacterium]